MRVFITDINIPLDLGHPMQASDAIEQALGPCDSGVGFGWRDIEVQSPDEADQQVVVRQVVEILESYDYPVAVNTGNAWGRDRAYVRTRTVEISESEPEPEIEQPRGLIPPGYEE
jgi:hypothetical protein